MPWSHFSLESQKLIICMLTVKWGQTKWMKLGLSTSVTAVIHKNNLLDQVWGWTIQNTMHGSYESAPSLIGEHNDDTCRGKVWVICQFLTPAHIHTQRDPMIQTRMSPCISKVNEKPYYTKNIWWYYNGGSTNSNIRKIRQVAENKTAELVRKKKSPEIWQVTIFCLWKTQLH